jgi:hypothetical protein
MVRAAKAYDPKIRFAYDSGIAADYLDDILPRMQRALAYSLKDSNRVAYRRQAENYMKGPRPGREFVLRYMHLYSRLFNDAGSPDYANCWDQADLCDYLLNDGGAFETANLAIPQQQFEELCNMYIGANPKTAPHKQTEPAE